MWYRGEPIGGYYKNMYIRYATTREIGLKLVYQFEYEGELPHDYPDVFYDVMSVEELDETFPVDFKTEVEWVVTVSYWDRDIEVEDEWVVISRGS
jgi:hypothetical protein